ncbi:MAG: hypothetical protein KGY99_04445 [Phycisphaerae bacterium]|nr:hypothetical protein [Phycisphaerae bacterium]
MGLTLGAVFWARLGGSPVEHMYVVISRPEEDQIAVVPLTTWEEWKDDSCYIEAGEYEELHHDSCVDYRHAPIVQVVKIEMAITKGVLRQSEPVSKSLLMRIWEGAADTRFLPRQCEDILSRQGLIA